MDIHLLKRTTGAYEDYTETVLAAYLDETVAKNRANLLNSKAKELGLHYSNSEVMNRYCTSAFRDACKIMKALDPDFDTDYTGVNYSVEGPIKLVE